MFIVVCVTCQSIVSNEEQCICVKICFMLEKTAFKMHKMLKTAYSANTMGSTQVAEKFLSVLNWGHYGWRSWVFRTLVTQTKTGKSSQNNQKPMTYHFRASGSLGFSYWISEQILTGWTCSKSLRSSCLGWLPMSRIRRNYWWLKTWLWSPNFLTCLILLLVNSYSFQEWNHIWCSWDHTAWYISITTN